MLGPARVATHLTALALIALIAVAALNPLSYPIDDPDFFWHLKTGEWIWEHKSLPDKFLFSLTTPEELNDARRFTMTSYWVVQIVYHLVHATGGMTGIAALRAILLLLVIFSLLLRREGKDHLVFLGTTLLVVLAARMYPFERPQIFSFVYCSFLLLLLDLIRSAPSSSAALRAAVVSLPLLMLLWANSHGSFVLGQGIVLLYLALEGVKILRPAFGPLPEGRYRLLLAAGGSAVAAAFLNPNTWQPLFLTQLPQWAIVKNIEYFSSVDFFLMFRQPAVVVYWLLLGFAVLCLVLGGKPDITRAALLVVTGVLAWRHVRHLFFFLVCAAPFVEGVLSRERFRRTAGAAFVVVALGADGTMSMHSREVNNIAGSDFLTDIRYPGQAVSSVQDLARIVASSHTYDLRPGLGL